MIFCMEDEKRKFYCRCLDIFCDSCIDLDEKAMGKNFRCLAHSHLMPIEDIWECPEGRDL